MGRDLHFRGGSFYRTDDRTGFPTRAERTRKEWNGLIVGDQYWEPRQPQDLVKGVPDNQSVPEPRPLAPSQYVGPTYTATSAAAAVGATTLQMTGLGGFAVGTAISVMLDSGVGYRTTVASVITGAITIPSPGLPYSCASGNLVTNLTEHISV